MSGFPDDIMSKATDILIALQDSGYVLPTTDDGPAADLIAQALAGERKRCAEVARNEILEEDDREAGHWNAACEATAKAIEGKA